MANKALHRFALFTAFCTFVLIFIGGLVTSTGSGLSVPDWPTTYGQNMFTYPIDKWVGGIKYEHGHRLFASFVGILTVILAVWLAIKEERKWVKWFGYGAVGVVVLQGILGGLTVLFLLPVPISVAHGMLAQTFFCIVSSIALFTSQWWREEEPMSISINEISIQFFPLAASIVVFIQLALGALLRHTYSGLAVPDFPLAYGQIFPTISRDAIAQYNQNLLREEIRWAGDTPIESYQIVIHMIHRLWAYVVAITVIGAGFKVYRAKFLPKKIRRNGGVMIAAVAIQFTLGALTVLTRKEVVVTTAHVAVGAFTLVLCVLTTLQVSKYFGFRFSNFNSTR
ncbi:MAG: COX15/CtaA family protein [Bacteroidota bacterium]|nr:COX15/CtaA family protein [Bacteroidota bacterium]